MKLNKTYQPREYEPNIYALWETSGAFRPTGQGTPYSIVMPPPNANGNLHIGHALFVACEDVLTRYHRMMGCDTIWIPGADHAGFETWVVFEKYLESQGKSRFEFTRDQLYQMTWDFVAENRGKMEMQLRALGASCDWDHQVFTLDNRVIDVVFTTFKKLWDDGLVYRGERIVNYCTHHDTSFADIEVDYQEENGKLWYIDYPLSNGQGSITVATTRPETMLGDEAVAVSPDDKRYKKLIGKKLVLPLVGKEIPVIADDAVESDFGTGAVKVTPAHDPTDFDIGQRHNLPVTSVISHDGLVIAPAPEECIGLEVETARRQVIEQLEHLGLISKIEDYDHQVPHCYKCGRVIQPLVKDQWFVSVQPLAKKAIAAIRAGKIKFTPAQKGEELVRYYEELRDWNISRQIPWGIPIPAFRKASAANPPNTFSGALVPPKRTEPGDIPMPDKSGGDPVTRSAPLVDKSIERQKKYPEDFPTPEWVFDTRVDQTEIEIDGVKYIRDEDTFDTWFSSGQWPYIVTRGDLSRFYPTSVMETGVDILRPWVARMIMLGLYVSGDIPFAEVYLHGLVNDEHNQKMSKSKGNVINPMDIIREYGSDAMRLGILANRSAAMPQAFSPATVVAGRNFCNKLWNIARFVQTTIDNNPNQPEVTGDICGHWVARQVDNTREQIEKLLSDYRFAEAYEVLYHVVWDDVADWFVEAEKYHQNVFVLQKILEYVLKLAHPFAPFVTETIWQSLYNDDNSTTLLISQQWPEKLKYDKQKASDFDAVRELVSEIRYLSAELGGPARTLQYTDDDLIANNAEIIRHLARLDGVEQGNQTTGLRIVTKNYEAWLSATAEELQQHYETLEKRLADTRAQILVLEKRLSNKSYVANAPAELVAESRTELVTKQTMAKRLEAELRVRGT